MQPLRREPVLIGVIVVTVALHVAAWFGVRALLRATALAARTRSPGYTGPRPADVLTRSSKLLLGGILAAVVIELSHDLLEAHFGTLPGPVDYAMHLIWVPAMVLVLLLAHTAAAAFVAHVYSQSRALHPVPFVAILGVQAFLATLRWRDVGASAYAPLTPDFLGGVIVGCACVYVARPLMELRRVRWLATLLLVLFASGAAVCDLIWVVEGGNRGTSWLWRTAVVDLVAPAFAFLIALIGSPLVFWARSRLWIGGALALGAIVFVATLPRGQRPIGVALSLAGALLFWLLGSWASFIWD